MSHQTPEDLGWQSGPSITTEEVRAADVWIDDVIIMTGNVIGDVYLVEYHGPRVLISWKERGGGTRSGVLIRVRTDMVHKVTGDA